MFSHQKLKVYAKALASVTSLTQRSVVWDKRHAVVDQLVRASESIVLNLAEGARLWTPANKQHFLDYAIGSTLECAACLDIVVIKQFLSPELAMGEKRSLCEVVRMLVSECWWHYANPGEIINYEKRPFSTGARNQACLRTSGWMLIR